MNVGEIDMAAAVSDVHALAALAAMDAALLPPNLTLAELVSLYGTSGRSALIAKLRASGVAAGHTGKLANALAKAVREGGVEGASSTDHVTELDLNTAAALGDEQRISNLLRRAQTDKKRGELLARAVDGSLPLMAASAAGHAVCVSLLLEARGVLDASRVDGSTAFSDAVQYGRADCVQRLLAVRADAADRLHHGWTLLHVAALHGHVAWSSSSKHIWVTWH